jgi:hypothetical protein
MKLLWLTTTHHGLESIMGSLVLYLNVSSMNQEGTVTGLDRFFKGKLDFFAYRYDEGKEAQFHYDGEVDHNIRRKVRELTPDIIIYSGPAAGKCKPTIDTLLFLKERAKTIGYVLDGGCPDWHPVLDEYKSQNVFDLTVNTDGNPNWPKRDIDLTIWQPVDEAFYKTPVPKDIEFGFAGGTGAKHRRESIAWLEDHLSLQVAPRYEQWGTYNKFSEFMLRCKKTVNFPETGSEKSFHLKNRILEAGFAHCALFEKKNPVTPLYFDPENEYFEYNVTQDISGIWLDTPEEEFERRARNLHARVHRDYTSTKMWSKVFERFL